MLAGPQLWVRPPCPAREQCAVHDVVPARVEIIRGGDEINEYADQQRGDR